ncbi:LysM peptidoglycan-binding domain-containing protein [Niallia sp. Krafla_26]|uniref:LysM peptidoglycan-binding domain-containing protein n=1 Tax=Niallia sp. Krafla_26 TaxID=3064703 RepID=UPI003D1772ED
MQYFYSVQSGDTLYGISRRWELPLESLIAANNLSPPYTIFIGQQLAIPLGVNRVRVKPGDTVYKLSQLFRIPPSVIIAANQLQPPYWIIEGQLLEVPPGVPYYVVQTGDTLYQLALRFNVITGSSPNVELIRKTNGLSNDRLFPGMRLTIPYAPTGDEGLIAYNSQRGGHDDIWLYNPKSGGNRQLTNGLGDSLSRPEWSPNSQYIAFVGINRNIYIVHVQTGAITLIDQLNETESLTLDWSPDSTTVAYVKQNGIILYHILTHRAQRIPQPGVRDVQWFPSGVELLFQAHDSSGLDQLYRIRTNGSGKTQITQLTTGPINDVKLSPDGNFALYTSPGASISIIYTVELSTGTVFEIAGGPLAKNYYPSWSPDSFRIAYSATASETQGYFSHIRVVGRRGENDRILAISNCFATPVTWSITGRSIGYLSGCTQKEFATEMWIIDINHPVPFRQVSGTHLTSLQWSPLPITEVPINTFISQLYRVRFSYPSNWQKVSEERYEGKDGFFQISAISSDEGLETVCQNEAFHPLLPYGSSPQTRHLSIQNQRACLIFPSADQPAEMRNQAALIVTYPVPIEIEGTRYQYFVLWADAPHIGQLGSTLAFI